MRRLFLFLFVPSPIFFVEVGGDGRPLPETDHGGHGTDPVGSERGELLPPPSGNFVAEKNDTTSGEEESSSDGVSTDGASSTELDWVETKQLVLAHHPSVYYDPVPDLPAINSLEGRRNHRNLYTWYQAQPSLYVGYETYKDPIAVLTMQAFVMWSSNDSERCIQIGVHGALVDVMAICRGPDKHVLCTVWERNSRGQGVCVWGRVAGICHIVDLSTSYGKIRCQRAMGCGGIGRGAT